MYCEDLNIKDCEVFGIKIAGTGEIFMDVFVQYSRALHRALKVVPA